MDRAMIRRWNRIVGKDDIVYHLGDFGTPETVFQLNGKIYMVIGNYERGKEGAEIVRTLRPRVIFLRKNEVIQVPAEPATYKKDEDDEIVQVGSTPMMNFQLVHEPSHAIYLSGIFVLFGHIHKLQMVKQNGLNVGVDCHNYTPVRLEDVLFWVNAIKNHYDEEVFLPEVGLI